MTAPDSRARRRSSSLEFENARHLETPDGGTLAYYEDGVGEWSIVWVHGLPLDSRSWRAQRAFFRDRFRNVFLDLRGYGASSKLPVGVASVSGLYEADIAALIKHLELERPHLVGFASAGHVALRLAARHPELIDKLAVLNASPKFRRSPDWRFGFDDSAIARFTSAAASGGIEAITDLILKRDNVFADVGDERAAALATEFREMSLNAGVETLLGFFENISRDDDRDLLPLIQAPTLVMSSTRGREVPAGAALNLRLGIPNARLSELPGADHFAFATRSALVNRLLESFLIG